MASQEGTDLRKWKLHVERGRQTWHYTENQDPSEQKFYDRYFLGLDVVRTRRDGQLGQADFPPQLCFGFIDLGWHLTLSNDLDF
jgi:hypothetical protein